MDAALGLLLTLFGKVNELEPGYVLGLERTRRGIGFVGTMPTAQFIHGLSSLRPDGHQGQVPGDPHVRGVQGPDESQRGQT